MIIKGKCLSVLVSMTMLTSLQSCSQVVEQADSKPAAVTFSFGEAEDTNGENSSEPQAESTVTTTAETTTTTTTTTTIPVLKGNIYDADGDLLMYSDRDERGKEVRRLNSDYLFPFSNILDEMSEGLDTTLDEQLREKNPTPVNGSENVGQSVQLTFDADKQSAIYNYMENTGINGAVVVLRSDGSLMAEVAYPSYNPEDYRNIKHDEDLAWGTYGNKAFQNAEPGSCFKIMSEVIADKHGITSLWDDGEWYYDGTSIVNWDHDRNFSYPFERSLYSAFINSSNIFFAKAFDQIGKEAVLADLDEIFHFVSEIDCDFGTLHNNIEIYCNDDLRRSAFGQSYVLTCPIYLAALGREAVFGEMVRPFAVKNMVDTNDFGSVTKAGSQSGEVIASIPPECRQNLLDGMAGVGGNLGLYYPEGYSFYAKTGTAETWQGDFLYITGILKNNSDDGTGTYTDYNDYNGSYIVVMQIRNSGYFGFNFASESAAVYQGLINTVLG